MCLMGSVPGTASWSSGCRRFLLMTKLRRYELANCRRGPWRAALMLNQILSDKEIASQGYMPMTSYYLHICEN